VVRPSQSATSNTGTSLTDHTGRSTCAAAVRQACLEDPDISLVALGVNAGPNVWPQSLHSGTIGGLLTAVSLGRVAIAFSADDVYSAGAVDSCLELATCEIVATTCFGSLLSVWQDHTVPFGISVNIPAVALSKITDVRNVTADPPESELGAMRSNCITIRELTVTAVTRQASEAIRNTVRDVLDVLYRHGGARLGRAARMVPCAMGCPMQP
jgi:5'/3'-nucleotidase SurE